MYFETTTDDNLFNKPPRKRKPNVVRIAKPG